MSCTESIAHLCTSVHCLFPKRVSKRKVGTHTDDEGPPTVRGFALPTIRSRACSDASLQAGALGFRYPAPGTKRSLLTSAVSRSASQDMCLWHQEHQEEREASCTVATCFASCFISALCLVVHG